MALDIAVVDSFAWAGGTGRFSPGVLNTYYPVTYRVGGMFGAYAIVVGFATYWTGASMPLAHFRTPHFNPPPGGGCDPDADPPRTACSETDMQLDIGDLRSDASGGLYFAGTSYLSGYTPSAFVVSSSPGNTRKLVAGAWNYIEVQIEMAGVFGRSTTLQCGEVDGDPNPYGCVVARINGEEVMRGTFGDGALAPFAACACFLCTSIPLGIGEIDIYGRYGNKADDLLMGTYDMTTSGGPGTEFVGDLTTVVIPVAGAGSSAQWTPVGAATNWQAAQTNDGGTSYNQTDLTGKRDSLALEATASTATVLAALPVIVGKSEYHVGGGPPLKLLYRRGGVDYLTSVASLPEDYAVLAADAGIPVVGETPATLAAGQVGYTTE